MLLIDMLASLNPFSILARTAATASNGVPGIESKLGCRC